MNDVLNVNLTRWHELKAKITEVKQQLDPLVEEERTLRQMITSVAFANVREGTATMDLGNGYTLKATLKLERKVDEAALPAVREQLAKVHHVNADRLLRTTYEVALKEYRTLTAEAQKTFDQALSVRPASPTLEIVPPKE